MHIQPSGELAFLIVVTGVVLMTLFFFYDQHKENQRKGKEK